MLLTISVVPSVPKHSTTYKRTPRNVSSIPAWLLHHIQLSANVLGTVEDGPSVGHCRLMWETQMKLLSSGFGLAEPWLLCPFGE